MANSPTNELLAVLAEASLHEANTYVARVLRAGDELVPPVFRTLIAAQRVTDPADFHLPEPLLGPVVLGGVLFIGMNPGRNAKTAAPRLGTSLSDYIEYLGTAFQRRNSKGRIVRKVHTGRPTEIKHFADIEDVLKEAGLGTRALGAAASYADAIPWKAVKPPPLDAEIIKMMRSRIDRLVQELSPRVVVTLGKSVSILLRTWKPEQPEPAKVWIGSTEFLVVASYHPGAWDKFSPAYRRRLGEAISRGLELTRPSEISEMTPRPPTRC